MSLVEPLAPESYRRIPWKNGRGELVVIDHEGGESWENNGVAWHFGRTAIVEEGPFSDYTGYERLQVVVRGSGLVLVASDHEIDLRRPMHPQRYDGGVPVRTVLEHGPVEVVNLIADRARFTIDLRVGTEGVELPCETGRHIVYAPAAAAEVNIEGRACLLEEGHALRVHPGTKTNVAVRSGLVVVGSIRDRLQARNDSAPGLQSTT